MSASRKHQKNNTSDSGPRTRSAVAEASLKKNFDIHDPIYKLPFNYGWKRELVYRKKNQKYKQGDVYYYSPNNKKLRSKKGVQEQLNLSLNENPLTIDNFTFIQQGIGLNDRRKEIIRDAYAEVSKIVPATLKRQAKQDPRGSRTAPGARPEGGRSGEDRQAYRRAPGAPGTDKKAEVGAGTAELDFRGPGAFGGFGRGRARGIGLNDRRKEIIRDAYAEVSKWNTVSLKNNGMVRDWEKCIKAICMRNSVVLDTRGMVTPSKPEEFKHFWETFALAIKNAKLLKGIELYRCSVSAVESVIHSLPQLTVLNATSLKNPTSSNNPRDLMVLNLNYLGEMVQLTELKLKGITGIKLTNLPSFEKLVNLKTLALTSIKAFPKDFNYSIDTVTKNLEFLEIGDVDSLQVEFAMILKRFTNLTSLRFENCIHGWNMIAKEVFSSIAGLKKLKILELINIDFNDNVVDGLQKLNNIKALLVIPIYISQSATTNSYLIDCLDKLSEKLTHFIWGITFDLLRDTDLYIAQFEKTQLAVDCDLDTLSKQRERFNNIPVLRNATLRWYLLDDPASLESIRETDNLDNVDLLQIPILKTVLQAMMERTKIEIVKVQVAAINQVYLTEHFDDV